MTDFLPMAKIKFYLDTRSSKGEKPSPLKLAVTHNRSTAYVPLNVHLTPEQWDSKKNRVRTHDNITAINSLLTMRKSEYDAALLVGMTEKEYSDYMQDKTAVSKGTDFIFNKTRYQVKANRPSGKKGSFVTMVPKATNYEWDKLIWILYDKNYVMQEAWEWCVKDYQAAFDGVKRLSPNHYRKGKCLYKKEA